MSVREVSVQATREQSSTQQEALGSIAVTPDGREYRYCKAGAVALSPGKLVVNADEVANHVNQSVAAAAAVGAKRVSVTLGATAATADQYKGGYLTINDAAGEGISYLIEGHAAIDSAGTGWIDLAEPIQVALTTSSEYSLHVPFGGVVISVSDQADMPVGVPNISVTAAYYFWAQTKGFCSVLADAAATQGVQVTTGTSTGGAVEPKALTEATPNTGAAQPVVGITIEDLVDTEYRPIFLSLT